MKVRFATDVLQAPLDWPILDRIVDQFAHGKHLWEITDFYVISGSPWLTSEDSRTTRQNLEALAKAFTAQAYQPAGQAAHSLRIVVTHQAELEAEEEAAVIPPEAARAALESPAYVVVENADSDGAFLKAIYNAFGREILATAVELGWLIHEHAGGSGNLKSTTERLLARNRPGPRRIMVLRDSDRMSPEESHSTTVTALRSWCEHNGVFCHVTHKRETENYVPLEGLAPHQNVPPHAVPRVGRCYLAFLRLSPQQRDFYDMKFGFKKGPNNTIEIPPAQQELFRDVHQSVLSNLRGGFGDDLWERNVGRKCSRDEIVAVCATAQGELDEILNMIERLL